jgi:hypothetical protein
LAVSLVVSVVFALGWAWLQRHVCPKLTLDACVVAAFTWMYVDLPPIGVIFIGTDPTLSRTLSNGRPSRCAATRARRSELPSHR